MIIFDLRCGDGHRFEGWFRCADDFKKQLDDGLLTCPTCQRKDILRVPSAVAIASRVESPRKGGRTSPHYSPSLTEIKAQLRQMARALSDSAEDVGTRFASEARSIHQQGVQRAIKGQASIKELEELLDEGVPVLPLPDISGDELN